MSTIRIYRDNTANAIFIEDINGVQFINSLQASLDTPTSDVVTISDLAKDIEIYSNINYSNFIDDGGNVYGTSPFEVVNNLNILFKSEASNFNAPEIISATSINVKEGDGINYELISDYGIAHEWDNLPVGVITIPGNDRKITGGSNLTALSSPYTMTMRAINYFGDDEKTLTINVSVAFSNTKSIKVGNSIYTDAVATTSNPLYRATNGSGVSDAWTISIWFKIIKETGLGAILHYGDDNDSDTFFDPDEGAVNVYYNGVSKSVYFTYGSDAKSIALETPQDSITLSTWNNVIITYDGGTTGGNSNDLPLYISRFKIYINGFQQTLTNYSSSIGFDAEITSDLFRLGRRGSGKSYIKNGLIDEVAIWNSDETSNVASIYNSGVPFDLNSLSTKPTHWWRMGDGDTFPTLSDNTEVATPIDFTMYNMTTANIVNDTP